MAGAVEFEEFVGDARISLARAFTAAYGPERGQEALAEAMAYAWTHFDELRAMDNPVGYLYRVGQSRTRPRKRAPLFPWPGARGLPDVEPALAGALTALTEHQRVCVVLVHAYEWTYQEVADLLGISRSTVQNHLERALARLRMVIGDVDD
jgi:RNA polymerase sigma-70 factor (ECF subfamily)